MFVKGIKKGKIIELLEEIDFPDRQEVLSFNIPYNSQSIRRYTQ